VDGDPDNIKERPEKKKKKDSLVGKKRGGPVEKKRGGVAQKKCEAGRGKAV